MTIAVIVACEESLYVIGDTLDSGSDSTFTINTQKVFYSKRHKIAMCIAGDGSLKPSSGSFELNDIIFTNFIVKDFFEHIEAIAVLPIENLQNTLKSFLSQKYARYVSNFFTGVEYVYGGFGAQDSTTTIYSYKGQQNQTLSYTPLGSDPIYFSNTNAVSTAISNTLTLPGVPSGMTGKKLLTENESMVLTFTIPLACILVRGEHKNSIGKYLDFVRIHNNPLENNQYIERKTLKYKKTPNVGTGIQCTFNPSTMPLYLTYRSFEDENMAFFNGSLKKYHKRNGRHVQPPLQSSSPLSNVQNQTLLWSAFNFVREHPYISLAAVVGSGILAIGALSDSKNDSISQKTGKIIP